MVTLHKHRHNHKCKNEYTSFQNRDTDFTAVEQSQRITKVSKLVCTKFHDNPSVQHFSQKTDISINRAKALACLLLCNKGSCNSLT